MLDWFVILSPVLLLFVLLLFAFVGCTGKFSGSSPLDVVIKLKYSPDAPPETSRIHVHWAVDRAGERADEGQDDLLVPNKTEIVGILEEQTFQYNPRNQRGQWTIRCNYFIWEDDPENGRVEDRQREAVCQFFLEEIGKGKVVTFEIVRDGDGGWLVQATPDSECDE